MFWNIPNSPEKLKISFFVIHKSREWAAIWHAGVCDSLQVGTGPLSTLKEDKLFKHVSWHSSLCHWAEDSDFFFCFGDERGSWQLEPLGQHSFHSAFLCGLSQRVTTLIDFKVIFSTVILTSNDKSTYKTPAMTIKCEHELASVLKVQPMRSLSLGCTKTGFSRWKR